MSESKSLVKSIFNEMFGSLDLSYQHQNWISIKSIGEVVSGSTPKTNNNQYWNGNLLWITPAEIKHNIVFIFDTQRKITNAGVQSCSLRMLPARTVLLTSRAPIGKVAIAGKPLYCNQGFKNIICDESKVYPEYLYFLLSENAYYLNSLGRGATFKEISKQIVENIKIPLPNLANQNLFVLIEKHADKLKLIAHQILEKIELLKKSIFNEMFNAWKDHKAHLGNYCKIERGASPRPISSYLTDAVNGVNWIKIGDTVKGEMFITHTKEKITQDGAKKSRFVYKGDFVLSNSMSYGEPYIMDIEGCVHDGWLIISNYEKFFNKVFLYSLLKSNDVQNQFKMSAIGATVNNLNSERVRNTDIFLPPICQQNKYSEIIVFTDKLKANIEQILKILE